MARITAADRVVDLRTMEFIQASEDVIEGEESSEPVPDLATQLVAVIGRELKQSGNVFILGHRSQFKLAHNTPQWRLWCVPNIFETDTDEQFLADLTALGIPSGTTRAQAREIVAAQMAAD